MLLLNASPRAGGPDRLAARRPPRAHLRAARRAAGRRAPTLDVAVGDGVQLGNKGGSITLLDAAGLKVAGVAYTAEQAKREGWTVTF